MRSRIILLFFFLVLPGFAGPPQTNGSSSTGKKIGLSPSLGYTYLEIENPDGTTANYDGFVLQMDLLYPLIKSPVGGIDIHLLYKNSIVDNLADGALSEKANFYGPGAGLNLYYGSIGVGANYNKVAARHSTSGIYSQKSSYEFTTITYYLDYGQNHKQFSFGGRLTCEQGDISKDETNYSKDVGFTAYAAWIYFTYITDFALF